MTDQRRVRISKFVSRHLRHAPADIGLVLEADGWILITELLAGAERAGFRLTREELDSMVAACEKQRFAIDVVGEMIRANQGHSTPVDMQFEPVKPPAELYHGTPARNVLAIQRDGLLKMARHHVHLSPDTTTATKVGARRGKAVILVVDAGAMYAAGHTFFRSTNGVWLVDLVPPEYLRVL